MSGVLFFILFAFYLSGLSGTVPSYRDSGDLIASIHTLGIAHPPGYALYVLLGKVFVTLVPFGNVAYRVNLFSAFCAAAATAVIFEALRRSSRLSPAKTPPWSPFVIAGVVTLMYGTSPAVMTLARVAEMYSLAAFLAGAILLCLSSEAPRAHPLAALLLGLGLSVHPTLIFLLPLFFAAPSRSPALTSLLAFLAGLMVFLYLPIRASQHPLVNWGDPSTWRNFWRVVTRADYGGLKLHPEQSAFSWSAESVLAQLKYFVTAQKGEWGWGALAVGSAGVFSGLRQTTTRSQAGALLAAWLLAGPGFFLLANLPLGESTTPAILQPYLLLTSLLWALFIGMGINGLAWDRSWLRGGIVLAVLVVPLVARSAPPSERHDFYMYDYARNLLRSLPPRAVLYEPDDPTHFSIQVLQLVENRRPDVVLLNFFRTRWGYEQIKRKWPDLLPPVPIESGQELKRVLWDYAARQRPFFAELPQKFGQVPYRAEGLVYAAQAGAFPVSGPAARDRAEALLEIYVRRGDYLTAHHPDFFTRHLVGYYAAAHCNLGLDYANAKEWTQAVKHYRAALAIDPELSAAYNNLGIVAFDGRDYAEASKLFGQGLALDPNNESLRKNASLALQKMRKLI